jgi:hypothetical protein
MKPATNPLPAATDFEFTGARSFGALFPAGDNNSVEVEVLAGTKPDRLFSIDVRDAGVGPGTNSSLRAPLSRSALYEAFNVGELTRRHLPGLATVARDWLDGSRH